MNQPISQTELKHLAAEELEHARSLNWRELSAITPWGDTYQGVAPSGHEVEFERNYLWEHGSDAAVRIEVTVRCLPERENCDAVASCVVTRPGPLSV